MPKTKQYVVIDICGYGHIATLKPREKIHRWADRNIGDWVTCYPLWDAENPPEIRQRPYAED